MTQAGERLAQPDALNPVQAATEAVEAFMDGRQLHYGDKLEDVVRQFEVLWEEQEQYPDETRPEQVAASSFTAGYSVAGKRAVVALAYTEEDGFAQFREKVCNAHPEADVEAQSLWFYLAGLQTGVGELVPPGFVKIEQACALASAMDPLLQWRHRETNSIQPNSDYL